MVEKLKTLKIIHIGLCAGVALAYLVLGFQQELDFLSFTKIKGDNFIYLLIPLSAIFLSTMLYKQQLKSVDSNLKMEFRIDTYQTASIMRWALLEGAAFFILFIKREFILIGLFLIFYMIFTKPSEEGMKRDFASVGK